MAEKIRTIFIGTPDFVVPVLRKITELEFIDLVGVITQPDKPFGRKKIMTPPPVKAWILENINSLREPQGTDCHDQIKIYQPEKLKDESEQILEELKPELIITFAYRQFIPKNMLEYPKYGCLNIHPSILPDLRGATPMPMAILNGYEETGVTLQVMGEGMDEGDVVGVRRQKLDDRETTESLMGKITKLVEEMLEVELLQWIDGEIKPIPQDHTKATYCYEKDISKEKAEIDWKKTAIEIDRQIRAFYSWPIAWCELSEKNTKDETFWGKRLKIYTAAEETLRCNVSHSDNDSTVQTNVTKQPGQIFKHEKELYIQTGEGILRLDEVQLEGKKKMNGRDYMFLV